MAGWAGSAVVFSFSTFVIHTLKLFNRFHQVLFRCLINGEVLIGDKHGILDFSLIKESLACRANCVLDAVLLGSTVKICSAALFQSCVLAFSPEDSTLLPFKMSGPGLSRSGKHILHKGVACRCSIADPLFADDTQIVLSRKRQTLFQIVNFFSHVQYAERPWSVFE